MTRALPFLLVAGCASFWPSAELGGDSSDTAVAGHTPDDVGVREPATTLVGFSRPTCGDGAWSFLAETAGRTNGQNLLNIWQPAAPAGLGWNEEHDLRESDADPEQLPLDLAEGSYGRSRSTAYGCHEHGAGGALVYGVRVYDVHGNLADCALASDGVEAGIQRVLGRQVEEPVTVTRREEFDPLACRDWSL